MPSKIIDEGIARLHIVKLAIGRALLEQGAQFHEAMTRTPRIESVEGNDILLLTLKRPAISQGDGADTAVHS